MLFRCDRCGGETQILQEYPGAIVPCACGGHWRPVGDPPPLDFAALRRVNVERCRQAWHHESDYSPADWMTCLVGEVGELAHLLKEIRAGGIVTRTALANEMADIVCYLDLLAARHDIDLGDAVRHKFNEVSRRVNSPIRLEV